MAPKIPVGGQDASNEMELATSISSAEIGVSNAPDTMAKTHTSISVMVHIKDPTVRDQVSSEDAGTVGETGLAAVRYGSRGDEFLTTETVSHIRMSGVRTHMGAILMREIHTSKILIGGRHTTPIHMLASAWLRAGCSQPTRSTLDGFTRSRSSGSSRYTNLLVVVPRGASGIGAGGHGQFMGSGNAWDMGAKIARSGKFDVLPLSEAREGDVIVRSWNRNVIAQNRGRNWGDIVVVTSRDSRGNLMGANDHAEEFRQMVDATLTVTFCVAELDWNGTTKLVGCDATELLAQSIAQSYCPSRSAQYVVRTVSD
ncbi:MAG: hypothetical protein U0103_00430 [Candidatus Obscuribacterales bacterium]